MAAYTLFDIAYRVARELSVLFEGLASSGSTQTSTVDSVYLLGRFSDDYFNAGTIYFLKVNSTELVPVAPEGEWARITHFAESTGTVTHTNVSAAAGETIRYAIHNAEYTLDNIIQNVNRTLDEMQITYVDTTTVTTDEDKTEYTLPSDMLNQNIKVWIQRNDTTDYNLWMESFDWYIAETATGTAKKLIFRHPPIEPWSVKIEYLKSHPSLYNSTDKLAEVININRMVCEVALKCLLWKKAQKSQVEPTLDMRIQELSNRVAGLRARYPINKPTVKLATLGHIDNFILGEEDHNG